MGPVGRARATRVNATPPRRRRHAAGRRLRRHLRPARSTRRTFTAADVAVCYRDHRRHGPAIRRRGPADPDRRLDASFPDAAYTRPTPLGATRFLVRFAAAAGVGTYSYAVGPDIRDRHPRRRSIVPRQRHFSPSPNVRRRDPAVRHRRPAPGQDDTTSTLDGRRRPGQPGRSPTSNVNLTLTHTFDGDLILTLIAPDGTPDPPVHQRRRQRRQLHRARPSTTRPPTAIGAAQSPPFTGSFRPDGCSLSVLQRPEPQRDLDAGDRRRRRRRRRRPADLVAGRPRPAPPAQPPDGQPDGPGRRRRGRRGRRRRLRGPPAADRRRRVSRPALRPRTRCR